MTLLTTQRNCQNILTSYPDNQILFHDEKVNAPEFFFL